MGHFLVKLLPVVIRILAVVGTIALLLVSGGIFEHNIDYLHHFSPTVPAFLKQLGFGIIAGLAMVALITLVKKVMPSKESH